MTRRARIAVNCAVPAFGLFEVVFRVQAPDECDGLQASAEGPIAWLGTPGAG